MASTPPLRIISVQDPPPAPRHGPAHDDVKPRYYTRSSQRIAARQLNKTPEPESSSQTLTPQQTSEPRRYSFPQSQHNLSPPLSPQSPPRHSSSKGGCVSVLSPSSPATRTQARGHSSSTFLPNSSCKPSSSLPGSAIISEGMLPTPVKTPRKKIIPNASTAARVLFQDQPDVTEPVMPTPRKTRKPKRHNGLSLESFVDGKESDASRIQIHTDSRDHVPELDLSEENPFVTQSSKEVAPTVKRVNGTSKRRKVTAEEKKDPQVQKAIKNDEGMVYVFRGKKVFKRFDDGSEEEESLLDSTDLGLLEHIQGGTDAVKLLKPLTRRSIKPKRLFQTEEQIQVREAERAEEEVTDVEVEPHTGVADPPMSSPRSSTNARRSPRSVAARSVQMPAETEDQNSDETDETKKAKKGSPFDSWKRVKLGAAASTAAAGKGRKRAASALER